MGKNQVVPVPAFRDNYIWMIRGTADCIAVDPGDAAPVLRYLESEKLRLSTILITHHHADHIGGLYELKRLIPDVVVYGPAQERIALVDYPLADGATLQPAGFHMPLTVMTVPGHTPGHIAYLAGGESPPLLFSGDVLFSVGCGRLLGGTVEQLYASLQRIAKLPADTVIYCSHEYTLNNIRFAKEVEPDNKALSIREAAVNRLRQQGLPSVPTVLADELAYNPFLRTGQPQVRAAAERRYNTALLNPIDVFRALRAWKDVF
jgi:hydroxyacylglutathione hydrolase